LDQLEAIDTRALMFMTRRIVRAIGLEATIKLLRERGGADIWTPMRPCGLLADLIGVEATANLIKEFGADRRITLPKVDKILLQLRDTQIAAEIARGDNIRSVARRYDLTTRQVQNILKDLRKAQIAPSPQATLF
jgi:hypothetical protein